MHPYIPHLLSDITDAHRTDTHKEESPQSLEEEFEEIDRWVNAEESEFTFGYFCGLQSENFPPPEQLTDEEMILIRKAFEKMMFSWNHGIDLPENLPVAFAYKMIVDSLNMKTAIVNSGQMHFDFCSGNAPDCAFKEFCPCLKYWNDPINIDSKKTENEDIKIKKGNIQNEDHLLDDYDNDILY